MALGASLLVAGGAAYLLTRPRQSGVPDVRLGVDKCAYCGMVIVDRRFAAAYNEGGRWVYFDDVICLLLYLKAVDKLGEVRKAYVHDYSTGRLIRAGEAYYVVNKKIPTPMGSGIAAFENREEAAKFGQVYTIEELVSKLEEIAPLGT